MALDTHLRHPRAAILPIPPKLRVVGSALLTGILLAAAMAPATAGATSWSVVPSPNAKAPLDNSLRGGVACTSATACTAVGYYVATNGVRETLVETWNGSSWSIVPSPGTDGLLADVSCISATACTAVGFDHNVGGFPQTLVESWNGTAWSIVPSPSPSATQYAELSAVSCTSSTTCTAVGFYTSSGAGAAQQTLVEVWNGTTWAIVASANSSASQDNDLEGVSCTSATACTAVGYDVTARGIRQTLIETWNGAAWTIVKSRNSSREFNELKSVACPSATACTAVGYDVNLNGSYQTLIETWNGGSWSIAKSKNNSASQDNLLVDVSCASATICTAVGTYVSAMAHDQTLIETWNGSAWSIVPSPNVSATQDDHLYAVACATIASCTAVGDNIRADLLGQTLVEAWNGTTWSVVPSPNVSATTDNSLPGVSCTSSTACNAVGYYVSWGGYPQTLAERWDGISWSIVPSANPSAAQYSKLAGVSCTSASACMAVGSYVPAAGTVQTLIETWNGTAWSIVPSPNSSPTPNDRLLAVSCTSATACMAVGTKGGISTLIEAWNGTSWSIVASGDASSSYENVLNGVSCTSAIACTAVGYYSDFVSPHLRHTLIEAWDGGAWSIVTSPDGSGTDSQLYGLSCTSSSACIAVGQYQPASQPQTLIEAWDGSAWSIVASPNAGSYENRLLGVSCTSATACTAVGYSGLTLIEAWDGTAWSIVSSPNASTGGNILYGVSCTGAVACTAVGFFNSPNGYEETLALQQQ